MSYTRPIDIQYKYSGIKYQAGNLQSSEPISIEIKGKYERSLFGKPQLFEGQIIIDGEMCYGKDGGGNRSNEYAFSKEKMSQIETSSFKGHIFISKMLKEITIEISEPENTEEVSNFGYKNSWLISAPCNTRKEAVEISNMMIQKYYKGVVIE